MSTGEITIEYQLDKIPKEDIREIGIKFELDDAIDSLFWERDPYWSYYPSDHLSARKAKVSLYSDIPKIYRMEPGKDWAYDTKSFYYDGTKDETIGDHLTNRARATKENIKSYKLYQNNREIVSVIGVGEVGCRLAKKEDKIQLFVNNKLDYIDLSWGNYQRNIVLDKTYSDKVVLQINTGKQE